MIRSMLAALAAAALMSGLAAHGTEIRVDSPAEGHADDLLRAALLRARPGDRVILSAGEYRLQRPLRFPRGGERGAPISLCAAPGEYVALLGSVRLRGWQRHEGRVWKVERPATLVKGLYEDTERLTHPRPHWGTREDPPLSELKAPGTWTQDARWVYLWSRESDTPDTHRIEASQHPVVDLDQPWLRVEDLHLLFGQNVVCQISADHCEVVRCEIAHCANSVDNSYNAYFSGCSHSAFRDCLVHDSYYWGDHGSNSHTLSAINCGDRGPNFVDGCEIFNGGLGVGSKGAVRELVVTGCRIYDQFNGVVISGERSSGPGAGKTDRGHYVIRQNRISDCARGVWISSGKTHGDRIFSNLIERCGAGVSMRNVGAVPDSPHLVNNLLRANEAAVYLVAGRDGEEKLSVFAAAGLASHHNLFFGNEVDWRSPLTWSRSLELSLAQVQGFKDLGLERGSLAAAPDLDQLGYSRPGCPALGAGAPVVLPDYIEEPEARHIGLGPRDERAARSRGGLVLSIAGTPASVGPGEVVKLRASLQNASSGRAIDLGGARDALLTFHFRYRRGHRDKQELYRCRVELPERKLEPGDALDLTELPGWEDPVNGSLGDAFHLRVDNEQWRRGCRLRATVRLAGRAEATSEALQELTDLIRSKEVLPVELRTPSSVSERS